MRVFLVGGVVRDLLLGRAIRDLDLVVAADGLDFARRLAARLSAPLTIHPRFATASIALGGGRTLDVAAARQESYRHPGALPDVAAGATIAEDLARRDFTVNAMAIELGPRRPLVDPFGGRADLSRGLLRGLHSRSFFDDPTRALRGVRYENRLAFRLERGTRRAIAAALAGGAMDGVSGTRLKNELVRLFDEPRVARAAARLRALGLAGAISPALAGAPDPGSRLRAAEALRAEVSASGSWLCYLLAWMSEAHGTEHGRVADRLALSGGEGRRLRQWARTLARLAPGLSALSPSELVRRIEGLTTDEIAAAASRLPAADRRALLAAADPSRRVALAIRGADLRAAGIPAGRAIGAALARTLAAREDGLIGAEEELSFALRAARGSAR